MSSIAGACDGPMPSVKPGRPMASAAASRAVRLERGVAGVGLQDGGAQLDRRRRPSRQGHRDERVAATALAYQRLVKPSASARSACSIMRSALAPPPVSPMRMGRQRTRRVPAAGRTV